MPWIFMLLMLLNGAYFGWKFVEGQGPQSGATHAVVQEGKLISLLSERPELLKKPEEEKEQATEEVGAFPAAAAAAKVCFNVGPFLSDADLRKFVSSLRDRGFTVRVESRRVDERDYWVFIPPFTNRSKAEERLRDLRSQGIEGFIVKDGVFVNAISLNHFSKKELADTFLLQMQKAGFIVEYREITKPAKQSWVYAAHGQRGGDLRGAVDGYLAHHDDVRKEITACEE
jgi:cell division septation protein DedD